MARKPAYPRRPPDRTRYETIDFGDGAGPRSTLVIDFGYPRTLRRAEVSGKDHAFEIGPGVAPQSVPGLCHHGQRAGVCGACVHHTR